MHFKTLSKILCMFYALEKQKTHLSAADKCTHEEISRKIMVLVQYYLTKHKTVLNYFL